MKEKVLTEEEEKIIKTAWKLGFYDSPPKITLSELAKKLGLSGDELKERVEEISRKCCRAYFEQFVKPIALKPTKIIELDTLIELFNEMEKNQKLKARFIETICQIMFDLHREELERHSFFLKFVKEWQKK
jgi:hypothetical protein